MASKKAVKKKGGDASQFVYLNTEEEWNSLMEKQVSLKYCLLFIFRICMFITWWGDLQAEGFIAAVNREPNLLLQLLHENTISKVTAFKKSLNYLALSFWCNF